MSTNKSCTTVSKKSIIKFTSILSVGTFLSRILGFIRDMIFASMMGTAAMADAFFVAFRIPNMLRDLVGEGATNSALVPVLSEYVEKNDQKKTNEFLNVVVSWAVLILGGLTLAGVIFSPFIVKIIAPGFLADQDKLKTNLTRIMFPYLLFIGLTAYSMGVLYTHHSFIAPAFSSCFLNIVMIISTLMAGRHVDNHSVYVLAAGVLIGGIAQLLYQWFPIKKLGYRWQRPQTLRHPGAQKIGRLLLPRLWGSAVYQSNVFIDTFCASLSSIVGAGGISAIYYANRIIQFPLGIFGVALASATLPTLSGYAAKNDMDGFRSTIIFSLRNILFMLLPSSVLTLVLAVPIIRVVFERGKFDPYSTAITAGALACSAIGLWAFGGMKITVSAFHALQDTKTPVKIASLGLVMNLALNFALMYPLKVSGIALASSVSGIINFYLLLYLLHKKIGGLFGVMLDFFWRMAVPLMLMAVITLRTYNTVPIDNPWFKLGMTMSVGMLCFLGAAWIFKIEPAVVLFRWLGGKIMQQSRNDLKR
jgi:putative peptidoglycan lipid II flippase